MGISCPHSIEEGRHVRISQTEPMRPEYLWLLPLGFGVGTFGTLIGAGGGFILVPVLLLLYPHESPELITSISLVVVFCNALSGSVSYARMQRIDYRSGRSFALATIPGAILGSLAVSYIPRRLFDGIFGVVMVAVGTYLYLKKPPVPAEIPAELPTAHTTRHLVDREGHSYVYAFDRRIGILISLFVGFFSSLLGIGGGIIHVPMMVNLLAFPVHIATATSHFILSIMALTGTLTNIVTGKFDHGYLRALLLSLGVLAGAQLGARLSKKIHGGLILKGLALALALAGLRILMMAFG